MAKSVEFVTPSCSRSFSASSSSSSSGVDEQAIVMVTLNPQSSGVSSEDSKTMATEEPSSPSASYPSRTLSRQSSSSSVSSTDSCLNEAKFHHLHHQKFDFLVWFSEKNTEEADAIFKVLEKEQKMRGFRYDRDLTPGRAHLDNIEEAIKTSWKILLLLSPEADDDKWFRKQMSQSLTHDVHECKGNVVPILLRKSRKDLPSFLGSISSLLYPSYPVHDETDSISSSHLSSPNSQSESSNQDSYEVEFKRFVENLVNIFSPPPSPLERKRPSTSRSISSTSESSSLSFFRKSRKSSSSESDSSLSSKSGPRRNTLSTFFKKK